MNEVDFVDFTTDSKAQPGVYQMMSTIQGDETIPGESFSINQLRKWPSLRMIVAFR